MIELVAGAAPADPAPELLPGDAARRPGHLVHGLERAPRDHRPARRGEAEAERDQDEQRLEVTPERALGAVERHADLDEPHEVAAAVHGHGEQAHARPPGEAHGLVSLAAGGGALPRPRREREPVAQLGRVRAGAALGVHELEELVVELRPEEIPQQRLGARALGAAPAGVADHLRDRAERGVEVLHEAPPQERVREPADHDEDPEQDRRVPEGEPEAHAERRPAPAHSPALST